VYQRCQEQKMTGSMSFSIGSAIAALMLLHPARAAAQSSPERFELGVQLPVAASGEFDRTDAGIGGRFAWRPTTLVGVEAEINLYPRDFPDGVAFTRGRTEGLFGVTVGPALRRVRPFARLRPGFVGFREAPDPVACILIFPPPLSCSLAAGRTVFALDVGGGIDVAATRTTFVRADAGDRLLRYPGPALDSGGSVREASFFSHDFRFAIGAGLRF
jgi:hypothetical protein